jgi:hypothetical protein
MADIARKTGIELSRIKRAAREGAWPHRITVRGGQKDRRLHKRPDGARNPHKHKKIIEQEVTPEGIHGVDLNQQSCRWPHGDPLSKSFRFCGKKAHHSLPYCLEHCKLAYEGFVEKDA